MRETKSRGLSKETKKWVYGYYFKIGDRCFIILEDAELDEDVVCASELTGFIEVIPEIGRAHV